MRPGVIEGAIGKVMTAEGHNRVALVSEAAGGRAATTAYRVLDTAEHSALLELAPRTGERTSAARPPRVDRPPVARRRAPRRRGARAFVFAQRAARLRAPRHQSTRGVRKPRAVRRDGRPSAEVMRVLVVCRQIAWASVPPCRQRGRGFVLQNTKAPPYAGA